MKLKFLLRSAVSIFVTGLFLYLAFRNTDVVVLWETLLQADLFWVLMLIPVGLLSHWIRAVRWRYLLVPLKKGMKLRNLFSAVMIGYAVNNILPRVGEIVRPMVVGKLEGVSRTATLGTVIIERVLDVLTFAFMVGVTLTLYPSAIDPFVDDPAQMQPIFVAGSIGATVLFVLLFFRLEWFVGIIERLRTRFPGKLSEKLGTLLQSFRSGLDVTHLRESWVWVVGWSLIMWALYALALYISFLVFESIASMNLGFGAAALLLVVSTIAFALPAPGAMGTYHSFLPAALVGLYGVDETAALGIAIITHEVQFIVIMIMGAYFYIVDHGRIGSLRETDPSAEGLSA